MSEEERDVYVKVEEYPVVYADGVVWRLEDEVCRIMLYQETLHPEDGDILDKYAKVKTITSEIRMPREAFRVMCGIGHRLFTLLDRADEVTEGIDDKGVNDAYWNATGHISEFMFDSAKGRSKKAIDALEDSLEDLYLKVNAIRPIPELMKQAKEEKDNE